MPALYKLSSEKIQQGSAGKGLTPVLLSGGSGGMAAPRVNVHAGDVRYTPQPIPQNVINTNLESVARLTQNWTAAAFLYQQREDKIVATNAIAEYEMFARQSMYGGVDPDGQDIQGYGSTQGLDAKPAYRGLNSSLMKKRDEILSGIEPGARQMAALSMQNTYNTAMQRASTHRARQMQEAEINAKVVEGRTILGEYDVDPSRAWSMTVEHANSFKDIVQRDKVLVEHMSFALKTISSQALKNKEDPYAEATAMKNMVGFYEAHRNELPDPIKMEIEEEIGVYSSKLEKRQKARQEENLKRAKSVAEFTMPTQMVVAFTKGKAGIGALNQMSEEVLELYGLAKGEEEIVKYYKDALDIELQGGTYSDVVSTMNLITESVASGNLRVGSATALKDIREYVQGPLKIKADTRKVDNSNAVYQRIAQDIYKLKSEPELDKAIESLHTSGMKKQYVDYGIGIIKQRKAIMKGETKSADEARQKNHYFEMFEAVEEHGRTPAIERTIHLMEGRGDLSKEHKENLFKIADTYATGKMPPEYAKLKSDLNKVYDPKTHYYDPKTQEVGFWNLLSSEDKIEIREKQKALANNSLKARKVLAVQSMMEEARRWVNDPDNPGRTYDRWFEEFYLQKPGYKNSLALRVVGAAIDNLLPMPPIVQPMVMGQKGAELYEWQGRPQTGGEAVPNTTGVQVAPTVSRETLPEDIISKTQPNTTEEKVLLTIPEGMEERYSGLDLNSLMVLEFLRSGPKPNIDSLSNREQYKAIRLISERPEYLEWLKHQ